MNNPWVESARAAFLKRDLSAAGQALTNAEARQFFKQTAINHSLKTVAVGVILATEVVKAGNNFVAAAREIITLPVSSSESTLRVQHQENEQAAAPLAPVASPSDKDAIAFLKHEQAEAASELFVSHAPSPALTVTAPDLVSEPVMPHTYRELQAACKAHGLSTKGKKSDLAARLAAFTPD